MASVTHNMDTSVIVAYPTREAQQEITAAEYGLVLSIGHAGKVNAIKFLRNQYKLGLYEAKQIVDTILSHAPESKIGLGGEGTS